MNLYQEWLDSGLKYRSTRAEVTAYYKQQYPGVRTNKNGTTTEKWRSKIATDMGKYSDLSHASLMRRFQKRAGKEAGEPKDEKTREEYRDLGFSLGPIPPKGYILTCHFWIKYSECEERDKTLTITGEQARQFERNPNYQGVINLYNKDPYDLTEEEGAVPECPDEESSVSVTAVY